MKKKNLWIALALAALALNACGGAKSATTTAGSENASEKATEAASEKAEEKAGESEKATEKAGSDSAKVEITKGRTVHVATSGGGEPYSLIDEKGNWTGIDAEIWKEIGNRTGWTIDVMQATGSGATFGQVDAKRADVAANCYAVNADRVQKYLVSVPYYGDAQCVVVKEDSAIKTFDDLKDKKVGVLNGQAAQQTIERMGQEKGFTVTLYEGENGSAGYQDVLLGRLDAFASTDSAVYKWENASNNKLRFLDERLYANDVAYYFAKTDEGKALRNEVNVVLSEMLEDGTVAKIVEKYMYSDMTKNIIPYSELGFTVE